MKARWVVPLLALALAGCPPPAEAPPPPPPPAAPIAPLPFAWPPEKGGAFPDLELKDGEGRTVHLSSYRGKTLLVEPVGMNCPGCQAFTGGGERGGFGGITPQAGLPAIDAILEEAGVDPRHPDLLIVQVLLFDLAMKTPTPADAKAWAAHFGLADRPNVVVLVGDDRLREAKGTYELVPGFFLVDQGGMLLLDATGHRPKDDLTLAVAPTVCELLGGPPAPIVATPPAPKPTTAPATPDSSPGPPPAASGGKAPWVKGLPDPATFPDADLRQQDRRCDAALTDGRWAELTKELDAAAGAGRLPGRDTPRVCHLLDWLARTGANDEVSEARRSRLDTWVAAAPSSAWPLAARAEFWKTWAWDARGSGYADTVTDDGARLFHERLELARADVDAALELDPGCLPALLTRLQVAKGQSAPLQTKAEWFVPVGRLDPPFVDACVSYLEGIMPKWVGGNGAGMWRFAREQVAAHPREPALRMLTYYAHSETGRMRGDWKAYQLQHLTELRADVEAVVAAYPRDQGWWWEKLRMCQLAGDEAGTRAAWLGLAETDSREYQCAVASRLLDGSDGYPEDPAAALRFLARAAHAEHPEAEARLASWIANGKAGLKADRVAAEAWWNQAAAHGDADTIVWLAQRLLEPGGDPERARKLLEKIGEDEDEELRARAQALLQQAQARTSGAPARRTEDGYEDWYPADIAPPRGTRYPCDLKPLPGDLTCLPANERRFVNHTFSLILEAAQARLIADRDCNLDGTEARYATAIAAIVKRLKAERVPPGLEPFVSDILAALDLQVRFQAAFGPAYREEMAQAGGKRVPVERARAIAERIPEGKQASNRLHGSWTKLEVKWGARFTPALRDSLMHHLSALDIY